MCIQFTDSSLLHTLLFFPYFLSLYSFHLVHKHYRIRRKNYQHLVNVCGRCEKLCTVLVKKYQYGWHKMKNWCSNTQNILEALLWYSNECSTKRELHINGSFDKSSLIAGKLSLLTPVYNTCIYIDF